MTNIEVSLVSNTIFDNNLKFGISPYPVLVSLGKA